MKKKTDEECLLLMKGAAERMIDRCNYVYNSDGTVTKLGDKERTKILNSQVTMCKKGERVLAIIKKAILNSKEYPIFDPDFNLDDYSLPLDNGFIFVGLVALMDPPREEVIDVIQKCHIAGIKVTMVTGDHPDTAVSIGI